KNDVAHSNLLFTLHDVDQPNPRAVFDEHLSWAKQHAPAPMFTSHDNTRDEIRPLRIAYISQDFRYHAGAHFLRRILEQHDRKSFQIFCYSNVAAPDAWTAHFQAMNVTWRDVLSLNDVELAQQLRADGIDIAVDLSGHTAGHRLQALALEPVPVQV